MRGPVAETKPDMPIQRILLPIDLSREPRKPIRYGTEIAASMNAELYLLHVVESDNGREHCPWPIGCGANYVDDSPSVRRLLLNGKPCENITSCANSIDADVILMPTRGHGFLRKLLLGSTTMRVLRTTKTPVWIAKPLAVEAGSSFRCGRILCGIQFGAEGRRVLDYAARWAGAWGAELLIVHVVPEISEALLYTSLDYSGEVELNPQSARDRMASMADMIDVPYQVESGMGNVSVVLRQMAARWRADVVIVGRGGAVDQRIGMNLEDIIERAPCPVIAVR